VHPVSPGAAAAKLVLWTNSVLGARPARVYERNRLVEEGAPQQDLVGQNFRELTL